MSAISTTNPHNPAAMQAKQALAKAEADVDADKKAHSPGCVAVDEKHVAEAERRLADASAPPASGTAGLSIIV